MYLLEAAPYIVCYIVQLCYNTCMLPLVNVFHMRPASSRIMRLCRKLLHVNFGFMRFLTWKFKWQCAGDIKCCNCVKLKGSINHGNSYSCLNLCDCISGEQSCVMSRLCVAPHILASLDLCTTCGISKIRFGIVWRHVQHEYYTCTVC